MNKHKSRIVSKTDYKMWVMILNDSNLIEKPKYISQNFNVSLEKTEAIINEFKLTNCVILNSKVNT